MANDLREAITETLWRSMFADSEPDSVVQEKKLEWRLEYEGVKDRAARVTQTVRKWLESEAAINTALLGRSDVDPHDGHTARLCVTAELKALAANLEPEGTEDE